MEYRKINTPKSLYIILFILMIATLFNSLKLFSTSLFCFFLVYLIIWISLVFTKSKVELQMNTISYSLSLFGFSIYKKKLFPENIRLIIFKRSGWNQKCVVIITNRGMNIRIRGFDPVSIYSDINDFSKVNKIKTKFEKVFVFAK